MAKRYWVYVHDVEVGDVTINVGEFDNLADARMNAGFELGAGVLNSKDCIHIVDQETEFGGVSIWVAGPKPSACIPIK